MAARGHFEQTSFIEGEWSPFMQGHININEYYKATRICLNYIPVDEECLVRRSGTRFAAHAKDNTGDIKLIEFISESQDSLICELTHETVRFYSRGALLTEGEEVVTSITAATPAVVTTLTTHGWSDGDWVVFKDQNSSFGSIVRNKQYLIDQLTTTTFDLSGTGPFSGDVDGTELNGILANKQLTVSRVVEKTLPYQRDELDSILFSEEENTLYLFHQNHEVNTIARSGPTVTELAFEDGPYLDENDTATTLGFSATTGSITVTASSTTGINGGQGFLETDIGRLIRVNSGTTAAPDWTWLKITAHTSTLVVTATVSGTDLAATTAVTTWQLGVYSDTDGHPIHGVIHENRLFLIGPTPGRIDASVSGDFTNFAPSAQDGTVADSNGVSAIFNGSGRQNGRWLQQIERGLMIGSDGGEFIIRASSFDDPITPFSIQVRRVSEFGAASDIMPVMVGKNSVFVQELGRGVIEHKDVGSNRDGNDIARKARHLTAKGITDIAYTREPTPIVWGLRGDGRLIGCTYRDDAEGRQIAWHRHSIEYANDVADGEDADDRYLREGDSQSNATIKSIAAAPFSDLLATRNDTMWVALEREDGVITVEYLTPLFDSTFQANQGVFSDSAVIYYADDEDVNWEITSDNGTTAVVTYYGLDHLEGKSVDIYTRGLDEGSATVSSGSVNTSVPSGLLTNSGVLQTAANARFAASGGTNNPSFLGENRETGTSRFGSLPGGAAGFIKGLDGKSYFIGGGVDQVSGQGDDVLIFDASDCSLAFTLTSAQVDTDCDTLGLIPPGGELAVSGNIMFAAVPETPYFVGIIAAESGVDSEQTMVYYRVEADSTLTLVGGYATDEDALLDHVESSGDNIAAVGFLNTARYQGEEKGVPYEYPIAICWGVRGDTATYFIMPSINYVLDNPLVLQSATDPFEDVYQQFTSSNLDTSIFNLGDGPNGNINSLGFILPNFTDGGKMYQYYFRGDLAAFIAGTESNANTHLDSAATGNASGLISSVNLSSFSRSGLTIGLEGIIGPVVDNENSRFVDGSDDTTSVFPFDDDGEDFDGNSVSANTAYYCNPTVYPSDFNDITKPWFCFWPKVF